MPDTKLDMVKQGVVSAPGTATAVLGAAKTKYLALGASEDGKTFSVKWDELDGSGAITDWEIATGCTYTHSTTTLTRGTLESSSTGARLSLTANAVVSVIIPASQFTAWDAGGGPATTDALTEGSTNLYHTAARVRATTLTGLDTGTAGTVSAADSILSAIGKIWQRLVNLATVATTGAYGDLTGRPTLGTAAPLDVAASGDASSTQVVRGNDTRLSDARTPTAHNQAASTISDSTVAGRALLTAADAAAQRSSLGLGTLATGNAATPPALGTGTPAAGTFSVLTATTELTVPSGAPGTPTTGDVYRVADTLRYRDSANAERLLLNATDNLSNVANPATARSNLGAAALGAAQTFTAAQRGTVVALTDAATVAVDFALGNFYSVTLAGNRTLGNPTNQTAGQSGAIFITQDATGSRTLAYSANWKFAGGTAPSLSTAANAVDRLDYVVAASGFVHANLTKDIK